VDLSPNLPVFALIVMCGLTVLLGGPLATTSSLADPPMRSPSVLDNPLVPTDG
jgi:hypothetical protein